ncbi:hypothetical protein VN12_02325 [Pirellula sp. SH-Sr6A]|uniref:hypothetical protein n=1 Tax=Pirellula sp. SH-Sr6A TaxID=1632865 RepID=UPI00078D0EB1|nr:hypothetical protein [Pirellula sp. SH-Sr6A]AMV30923.1 hypothetical protein VN12_02325 [Pirellula sp. SH-Sr6A]
MNKDQYYGNAAWILVSGLVCLCLTVVAIYLVAQRKTTQIDQPMPAFFEHKFGEKLDTSGMKEWLGGKDPVYEEAVKNESYSGSAKYFTVGGVLYSAELTVDSPYYVDLSTPLREKFGYPTKYEDKTKTWQFTDGSVDLKDNVLTYRSDCMNKYFSEQFKQQTDKTKNVLP